MEKWACVPRLMLKISIPQEIENLMEPYKEIEIEKYIANKIMYYVDITEAEDEL